MKDAVLISIHRKWVEKIASGEKKIEVRKNFPRLKPPFKCYVYEPKKGGGSGKVVMEFECEKCIKFRVPQKYMMPVLASRISIASCVPEDDLREYANGEPIYGWKISRVKVYDKPKDVFDFGIKRVPQSWVNVEEVL